MFLPPFYYLDLYQNIKKKVKQIQKKLLLALVIDK